MKRAHSRIVAVVSLLAFLASTPAVSAAPGTKEKELRARKAFAAGQHREALDLFAELYAETLHPVYLRNIGRCQQKMGAAQEAIGSFRDYLAKAKVDAGERREIDGYIKEMEALLERQRTEERARVAEKPPEPAPPPPPPDRPSTVALAAPPPPDPPPPPDSYARDDAGTEEARPIYTKWWFWTGVGAVVAGAVVTAVLLSGGGERPSCPGRPEDCQ